MEERKKEGVYEEEIDLYELLLKLKRRWRLILGTVFLFLVIAYTYAFLIAKPQYRISALLRPGVAYYSQGGDPRPTFQPKEFPRMIRGFGLYLLSFKDEFKEKFPEGLPRVSSSVRGEVIELFIYDEDPERGKKKLIYILEKLDGFLRSKVLNFSRESLRASVENLRNEIKRMDIEISFLKAKINVLQERLISARVKHENLIKEKEKVRERIGILREKLTELEREARSLRDVIESTERSKSGDLDLSSVISLNTYIGNLRMAYIGLTSKIIDIRREINSLEARLLKIDTSIKETEASIADLEFRRENLRKDLEKLRLKKENLKRRLESIKVKGETIEPVNILAGPFSSDKPEKPRKTLIMAVSFVSSFFLGIFLALLTDWLSEARTRHGTS